MGFWKLASLSFFYVVSFSTYAFHQRHCSLLPITDNRDGVYAFPLFKRLEQQLKQSPICQYHRSSEILNVLQNYSGSIEAQLKNPAILKQIAQKLRVGSLIRIHVTKDIQGLLLEAVVVGENGDDIFLRERMELPEKNFAQSAEEKMTPLLELYFSSIPYDGQVVGLKNDQLLVEMAHPKVIPLGSTATVKRVTNIERHPLLRTIVGRKTKTVGKGLIVKGQGDQVMVRLNTIDREFTIRPGDWVQIDESTATISQDENLRASLRGFNSEIPLPELGFIRIAPTLTTGDVNFKGLFETDSFSGFAPGLLIELEAWATERFFGNFLIGRTFLDGQKRDRGSGPLSTLSGQLSETAFYAGLRTLLTENFFGPQLDVFVGYGVFGQSLGQSLGDFVGDGEFTGLLLGLKGVFPFGPQYLFRGRVEFSPFLNNYNDESSRGLGAANSLNIFRLSFAGHYYFNPRFSLFAGLRFHAYSSNFSHNLQKLSQNQNHLSLGVEFGF